MWHSVNVNLHFQHRTPAALCGEAILGELFASSAVGEGSGSLVSSGQTGPTAEGPGGSSQRGSRERVRWGVPGRPGRWPVPAPFSGTDIPPFFLLFSCDPRCHYQRVVSRIWPGHGRLSRGSQPRVHGPPGQVDVDGRSSESPARAPAAFQRGSVRSPLLEIPD